MKLLITLLITLSTNAFSFDFSLDYHGADVSKIKKMGCRCDFQHEVDFFLTGYYAKVARELKKRGNSIPVGIIDANATTSNGFMGSHTLNLNAWLVPGDIKPYERVVLYLNWPEFGGN